MQDKIIRVPPPVLALALLGLAYLLDRVVSGPPIVHFPLTAAVLGATGAVLGLSGVAIFRSRRTSVLPWGAPTVLVTIGPYEWTRNPMYLGLLTAVSGVALAFGSLPMILAPAGFFYVINRVHIPAEEDRLKAAFGDAYLAYRDRVVRWL